MFTSDAFPDAFTFLLGAVLERPSVHTLMAVAFESGEVQLQVENGGVFVIKSDRQLLLEFLELGGSTVKIDVEVWRLQAFLSDTHRFYALPEERVCSFQLSSDMQPEPTRARAAALPFGLQVPQRKRKPQRKIVKANAKVARPAAKRVRRKADVIDLESESDKGDMDRQSVGGSSSDSAGPDNEIDVNRESERMAPVSATAHAQEQELAGLANEVHQMDTLREEVAQTIRTNKPVGAGGGKTFFAKELGLDDGSLAVSARAVCLCCKLPIPKGSVRFSWHNSTIRPPGWLHASCVIAYTEQTGLRAMTLQRLSEISQRAARSSSSSSSAPVNSDVSTMAAQLLTAMQQGQE